MYVLGTAGHVDHGKTTLIRALTGIDPDRLAEEKRRGLTIDLGFAWLALPITLLVVSRFGHTGGSSFLGFIGALMLAVVLPYLPFLQLRLATTNRLRGAFEVLAVRRDYGRAPWAFSFAFVVTLLFALPLYLLKIQVGNFGKRFLHVYTGVIYQDIGCAELHYQ